ncbi:zinc ribbon domain-containing protein [Clostridium chromiireducens]|uniref:Zinc ribbon domain-containing protein n=1 Tax=Clostridium chromiireducens TaxID=225345 RepID=A0A399IHX4_9CLOT|nr:zinc-ribbon domain-containing protein [Clostridium chromiireducens]RII32594.1 zinc ribbon domain-containing protein [Clostridium chromiireducens]
MKNNKIIIYLLLGVILIIFAYNFILPGTFNNYNSGMHMGMGMHMGGYRNSNNSLNYYSYLPYIIFIFISVILGLMVFNYIFANVSDNKCKKCGYKIDSETWKVCPKCGTKLLDRGGDKK